MSAPRNPGEDTRTWLQMILAAGPDDEYATGAKDGRWDRRMGEAHRFPSGNREADYLRGYDDGYGER